MRHLLPAVILALLLGAGCGDGSGTGGQVVAPPMSWGPASQPLFPSAGELGIVGLWFQCRRASDEPCAQVGSMGLRFGEDGTWVEVRASGTSLEEGGRYCEMPGSKVRGTYLWDGTILTLYDADGGVQSMRVALAEDLLEVSLGSLTFFMRRVTADSGGLCRSGGDDWRAVP